MPEDFQPLLEIALDTSGGAGILPSPLRQVDHEAKVRNEEGLVFHDKTR